MKRAALSLWIGLVGIGTAWAEPSLPELAGTYRYQLSGVGVRTLAPPLGQATLSVARGQTTLALDAARFQGAGLSLRWVPRAGVRGALTQATAAEPLTVTLTARNTRLLVGELRRGTRWAGRVFLVRDVTSLQYVGFDPAPPAAKAGLRSILAGEEWRSGIPTKLFKLRLIPFSREGLWKQGHLPAPPQAPGRDGFAKLPLGLSSFERDGVPVVNTNCFACHSGVVAGRVVAGLPSTNFDAMGQRLMVDQVIRLYRKPSWTQAVAKRAVNAILSAPEERQLNAFLDYYQSIVRPSIADADGRGINPGPHVVWRTLARLRQGEDGAWSLAKPGETTALEQELLRDAKGQPKTLPPVDPNPWWHLKYKRNSFWLNDVSHLSPATFSLNLLDEAPSDAEWEARLQRTQQHLEFARQTKAPAYPGPIDDARADRGFQLYSNKQLGCAVCHGDTTREGKLQTFPNWNYAVGTDPAYARLVESFRPLYAQAERLFANAADAWFLREGANRVAVPPTPQAEAAYGAPPLVGVWASAPYFHNGSVPTLAGVLDPTQRPAAWRRTDDPFAYDLQAVGLRHTPLTAAQVDRRRAETDASSLAGSDALELRRIYDTRLHGRSNQGHDFTRELTPEQRLDLLEYLKRL